MNKRKHNPNRVVRLNAHQRHALRQADDGNTFPLITCCIDCHVAIAKVKSSKTPATEQWCKGMLAHYRKILAYLESKLPKGIPTDVYHAEITAMKG